MFNHGNKKFPKFEWNEDQLVLFKQVLESIRDIIERWNSEIARSNGSIKLSDYLQDKANVHLIQNTVQLVVLTADTFIALLGGLKNLMAECCGINNSTTHGLNDNTDLNDMYKSLLQISLQLVETFVLKEDLKYPVIEGRMKMEPAAIRKQCLRLILTVATLDCIRINREFQDQQCHYHSHKLSIEQMKEHSKLLLKIIAVNESSLDKYISESLNEKLVSLKECQLILDEHSITLLHQVIAKDADVKLSIQPLVSSIVYYLSVLCVARYKNILDSVENNKPDSAHSSPVHGATPTTPSRSQSGNSYLDEGETSIDNIDDISLASATDLLDHNKPTSFQFFGNEGVLHPPTIVPLSHAVDVSEQVSVSLKLAGACLCQFLIDYKSILSKILTGKDGKHLLNETAMKLLLNNSIVEVTMLLCSQEWQMSLQKTAVKYFASLIADGRHVAHFSEAYLRTLSFKNIQKLSTLQESNREKFTNFEEQLSVFLSDAIKVSLDEQKMKRAQVMRSIQTAEKLWRKLAPIVDNCGSFDFTPLKPTLLWRLEMKEDYCRRRMKLIPNPGGSSHVDALRDNPLTFHNEETNNYESELAVPPLQEIDTSTDELESLDVTLNDTKEVPHQVIQCSVVALAYLLPGTLTFTNVNFTFTADDTTDEYSKVINIAESCPVSDQWLLSDVTAVFTRFYIHQYRAIEIFFNNKTSIFVVMSSYEDMRLAVQQLPKVGIGSLYGLPQTRSTSLSLPHQLFKKSNMTDRWMKREITNFQYLMFLNTISGRSFNDLSQYPVFPWIIKDYSSDTIDLNDTSIYRDLTKPIGALNPTRLHQYQERYELWESDTIPSFHYGTHYSTMAFVVHWLVRMEPFTSLHVDLHDGFFDHGSRLFSSVARAWNNCQSDSSDVKELIPEFFYLPEMFKNDNKFLLGYDEYDDDGHELPDGQPRVISDVVLPPWAESPHHFVHINKQALESEYVSSNLHHWIDLIFGDKQRGPKAIESFNVFYYLTYSGSVKWQAITDDNQLQGLEQQVLQFGQTPRQLLKEPHPQRNPPVKEYPPKPISSRNPAIVAEVDVTLDVPVGLVHLSVDSCELLTVSYNQLFGLYKWNYVIAKGGANLPPNVSISIDQSNSASLKARLGEPLDQSISASSTCIATTPTASNILMCGFWDSSFKVFSTDNGACVQSVFGHRSIVTCVTMAMDEGLGAVPGDGLVATGSHDVTVLLWKWSGKLNRIINVLDTPQGSVNPMAILNGHEKSITCVAISASQGLVASGAKQGCCLIHGTSGELLHKLVPSSPWCHPHMCLSCPDGSFVIHYADVKGCLSVFTCNGGLISYKSLEEPALAMTLTPDGHHLIIGGFTARVYVLNVYNLNVIHVYDQCESSIRSLHVSHDHRFIFAGLASGAVAVLATHIWRLQ
jgi:WD40 repeat protein